MLEKLQTQKELQEELQEEKISSFLTKLRLRMEQASGEDIPAAVEKLAREEGLGGWCWQTVDFWERLLPLLWERKELVSVMLPRFLKQARVAYSRLESWRKFLQEDFFRLCREDEALWRMWYGAILGEWMESLTGFTLIGEKQKDVYMQIIRQCRPECYSDEDFFQLVLEKGDMENSVIYLLWMKRVMGRKLRLNRDEKYGGTYLHELLAGEWMMKEKEKEILDEDDRWIPVGLTMAMEAVGQIEGRGGKEELKDGFPVEDHIVLEQNDLELFMLCRKNGLLRGQYVDAYREYAMEKKCFALMPGILQMQYSFDAGPQG